MNPINLELISYKYRLKTILAKYLVCLCVVELPNLFLWFVPQTKHENSCFFEKSMYLEEKKTSSISTTPKKEKKTH